MQADVFVLFKQQQLSVYNVFLVLSNDKMPAKSHKEMDAVLMPHANSYDALATE